jgi:Domain of unknown function (DUF1840)
MLYIFKSKAAADLIMLQPNGERILKLIGKEPGPKGIILPEQMPAALKALEGALTQEDAALEAAVDAARSEGAVLARPDSVSLRQRAVPFIDMLRRCHKAGKEIVWGV